MTLAAKTWSSQWKTEGVVIETPDGHWLRVGIGQFTPTDFSAAARARLLLSVPGPWLSFIAVATAFTAFAFIMVLCRWQETALATVLAGAIYATYFSTNSVTADDPTLVIAMLLTWPVVVAGLFVLLKVSTNQSVEHRTIALTTAGFVLAGAIFGFPGFSGTSLLLLVWVLPQFFLPMIAMALFLLATAVRPYLPMGSDWRKAAVATVIAMMLGLIGPVILWLQYMMTLEEARSVSIG